jgi:hypothetical protein
MYLPDFIINEAIKEAKKSTMNKQISSLLIYRNKIVSKGHNILSNGFSTKITQCFL